MSGPGMVTGGGAGRGGVLGRLTDRLPGGEVPAWALVAVGGREAGWSLGTCSLVVTVAASGPVRVHYALAEPAGPVWLRLVEVSERRRRRVLRAVLGCGALEGAGPRVERAGARAGGDASGDGAGDGVTRFGWLHVAAGNRTVWTDLPEDGRIGGVGVRDLVLGLVPRRVWRELHARRAEAWQAWARRAREIGAPLNRTDPMDQTHRDLGSGLASSWGPGLDDRADDGPAGGRSGGPDGGDGGGWPGIRHGGGLGGAW